jgi:uncharacterized membrane protein
MALSRAASRPPATRSGSTSVGTTMTERTRPDPVVRLLHLLPLFLILVAVAASLLALPHLPERMPIHWGIDGRPSNFVRRGAAVLLPIVFMAHSWLMVGLVGWALGRSTTAAGMSPRVIPGLTSAVVGFLLLLHLTTLANGLGWSVPVTPVVTAAVGLLFIVLGWKMRCVPQNPVFGVRTPTTLRCPEAWREANDVGGRAFVYAGLATIVGAFLPAPWPFAVMMGSILLASAAGIVAGRRAAREGPVDA